MCKECGRDNEVVGIHIPELPYITYFQYPGKYINHSKIDNLDIPLGANDQKHFKREIVTFP